MLGSKLARFLIEIASVLLLASSAQAQTPFHEKVSLNGTWTFTPLVSTPSSIPSGPITVPSWWSDGNPAWDNDWFQETPPVFPDPTLNNKEIKLAKYERTLVVPTTMASKRIKLRFEAVNYTCEVKINGQSAGAKHYNGFIPFEYDITNLVVADGTTVHNLEVTVGDFEDGDMVSGTTGKYMYPMGHPPTVYQLCGIADNVTLYAVPAVYVKDVFVKPSITSNSITLEVTVANDDTVAYSGLTVAADIYKVLQPNPESLEPTPALSLASGTVNVAAGGQTVTTINATWTDPVLWWPDAPQLYRLHATLKQSSTPIDENKDARFGFREFKVDGNRYSLNGVPFHGWGDSTNMIHWATWNDRDMIEYALDVYKNAGCRLIRHGAGIAPSSLYYDICDEKGMLCYAEMNYNAQNAHEYYDTTFQDRVDAMMAALVTRDRNHPSIVIWSLSNEIFYGSPPAHPAYWNYADILASHADVIAALDDTRPIGCDSDGSLDDRLDIKNKHYPHDVGDIDSDGPDHGWTNDYNPNPFWVLGIAEPAVPVGVGEYMFNDFPSTNENSYNHSANWGVLKALMIRGYRLAGFSDIRPFTLLQEAFVNNRIGSPRRCHMFTRHSMAPVAVYDFAYDGLGVIEAGGGPIPSYNEGSVVSRNYVVFNDDVALNDSNLSSPLNTSITINWEVSLYGTLKSSGTQTVTVPLGEVLGDYPLPQDFLPLSWTVPQVQVTGTPFVVGIEAEKNGQRMFKTHYVFLANDLGNNPVSGLDPVNHKGTFVDDFETSIDNGWREHDNFWTTGSDGVATASNQVYRQPETKGLFPYSRWGQFNGVRTLNSYKFGQTWKSASPRAYKYQDLRASCDIRILSTDGGARGAGIGFRMMHPDSSPWFENDATRRSGYFVKIHHNNGAYSLKLGKATSTGWFELATKALPSPGVNPIHLEVKAQANVLTATANCIGWNVPEPDRTVSANDTTYASEGYVSLIMEERVAAEYDNVQFGTAPYPPEITSYTANTPSHSVDVSWSPETDWGGSSANVQYKVDWSTHDETYSGSSGWITGTGPHQFTNLPGGRLWFQVRARDANQQVSAPSQARMSTVAPLDDDDSDGINNETELTLGSDLYDDDTDGDGMSDGDEYDSGNGCTDLFDTDSDDDGLSDGDELANNADPCEPDTDGDGINDGTEVAGCSEPDDVDTDGDSLEDGFEVAIGTDPCDTDTDNDLLLDNLEAGEGCDPLDRDTDHDGALDGREVITMLTDPLNRDSDGDAFSDGLEDKSLTSPRDSADMPADLDWALTQLGFGGSQLNTADYNGAPAPTIPGANGIPDSFELAVIAQILRNPNHPLYAVVRAAWEHNSAQMYVDLVPTGGGINQYNARSNYLAAYMTLGDADSIAAAVYWADLSGADIVSANYITGALPGCVAYLAKTGDADVDGSTNQSEYNATLPLSGNHANDLADYLNVVLTPALRLALSAPAVRTGQQITITLIHNWPPHVMPSPGSITWTTTGGTLTGSAFSKTYTAPANRRWSLVTCQGPGFKVSVPVFTYSRWMMVKSDDMRENGFMPTPRPPTPTTQQLAWERYISFMEGRHLRGNFGVISDSLDVGSQAYFDWLMAKRNSGHWELWSHGYDHADPEFQGTSYQYQLDHLTLCQDLAVEKLGSAYQAFAPPFNAADANTTLAMNAVVPEFKVWIQASPGLSYEGLVMDSITPEGPSWWQPNLTNFQNDYNANLATQDYCVSEFHPGAWGQSPGLDANFAVFKSIVDWLYTQEATFIRVMEYYDLVTNGIVPMDGRLDSDADGILDIHESYADLDNDKIPEFLDADSDNDAVNDGNEDSDADTYKDAEEIRMGFDEFDATVPDNDKDLYFNVFETLAGTNPNSAVFKPRDLDAGLTVYGATNLETYDVNGASGAANGIPDSYELTVMTEEVITIKWSCNFLVKPAWRKNLIQMYADLQTANEPWTDSTLAAKAAVLAGFMTVGDANSVAVAVNYIQARDGVIDTTKYTTGSYPGNQDWLAYNKDADFDSITNINEFLAVVQGGDHRANLDAYLVEALAPNFDSIMPVMGWTKTVQDQNSEAAGAGPNGMLDAHELALVEAILRNTSHTLYIPMRNAYQKNLLALLAAEGVGGNLPQAAIYAGYATLGDTGSMEFVDILYDVAPSSFDTTQSNKVAKAGDADTDGRVNGNTSGTEYFNAQAVYNHVTQFDLFQGEFTGRALNPAQ